jgi:uncharacterized protein YerC
MRDSLLDLARRASEESRSAAGLRAIAELKAELAALERERVAEARAQGSSWSEIARHLGVTRQAVHRKHREAEHGRQRPVRARGVPPRRSVLITSEARSAMQLARREAQLLGRPALAPEHIMLGVLACARSPVVTALADLGLTLERARAAARRGGDARSSPRGRTRSGDQAPSVSPEARGVLEQSLREAVDRGDGYLSVEHLVLALVREEPAVRTILDDVGVAPAAIARQIDAAL